MHAPAFLVSLALALIAATGAFLAVLGIVALAAPSSAKRFLLGFAATPARHYLELTVRLAVGLALLVASPRLPASSVFAAAGAVLMVTTVVMAALPYRAHAEFARRAVPKALAYLPLIGAVSLVLGVAVAWAVHAASVA